MSRLIFSFNCCKLRGMGFLKHFRFKCPYKNNWALPDLTLLFLRGYLGKVYENPAPGNLHKFNIGRIIQGCRMALSSYACHQLINDAKGFVLAFLGFLTHKVAWYRVLLKMHDLHLYYSIDWYAFELIFYGAFASPSLGHGLGRRWIVSGGPFFRKGCCK